MSGFGRVMGGVLVVVTLALSLVVSPALTHATHAVQGGVFVQVNPNTLQAGYQVGINASCGEDLNPARVSSSAFGEVTLTPVPGSRFLQGSATVPSTTRAGEYRVNLRCANGSTATTDLFVLGMATPTRGPNTGGGGTAAAGGPPTASMPALLGGASAVALAAGFVLLVARRRTS